MHAKHPRIFSPLKLGPVELPIRFYLSPHVPARRANGGRQQAFR